jgi:hypothetical protein
MVGGVKRLFSSLNAPVLSGPKQPSDFQLVFVNVVVAVKGIRDVRQWLNRNNLCGEHDSSIVPMTHFSDQFAAQRANQTHVSEYPETHCVLGSGDQATQVFRATDDLTERVSLDGESNAWALDFKSAGTANFGIHEFA